MLRQRLIFMMLGDAKKHPPNSKTAFKRSVLCMYSLVCAVARTPPTEMLRSSQRTSGTRPKRVDSPAGFCRGSPHIPKDPNERLGRVHR